LTRYSLISALILCLTVVVEPTFSQSVPVSQPVVIQRRMIRLTPPDAYQFAVSLEASRQLTVRAPFDSKARTVSAKAGGKVLPQTELVALESERLELVHKRAIAALDVADGLLRIARKAGHAEQVQLGEAQVALAQADLALSTFDKNQTSLRAPYEATVLKVHVQTGQEIRTGEPLVTIGDLTSLECRVPVDRKSVNPGQTITLTIEDVAVVGIVQAIEPVGDDEQRLRDLAVSVAMAVVSVRNNDGKLAPGQSVFPNIVPNDPVARVPLESVSTTTGGRRIVQVLRDHIVKSVPVVLHGQIGTGDLFVSGPFTENDQVIISASIELADSTAVKPSAVRASTSTTGAAASNNPAVSTQPRKSGAAGF
jgi:membrane fusion protein, multidrug efflux system